MFWRVLNVTGMLSYSQVVVKGNTKLGDPDSFSTLHRIMLI